MNTTDMADMRDMVDIADMGDTKDMARVTDRDPLAMKPITRNAALMRSIVTLVMTRWVAGMATTVSSCYEAHYQECSPYEINCDAGYDSMGCWYGNYCIQEVNEYDGCYGVCGQNCNYETEDWCDMGFDSNGCWT